MNTNTHTHNECIKNSLYGFFAYEKKKKAFSGWGLRELNLIRDEVRVAGVFNTGFITLGETAVLGIFYWVSYPQKTHLIFIHGLLAANSHNHLLRWHVVCFKVGESVPLGNGCQVNQCLVG